MRVRQVVVVGLVTVAGTLGVSGLASACTVCDQFFQCVSLSPGAKLCISNLYSCAMMLPCAGGGVGRLPDAPEEGFTAWSIFDADGSPAPAFEPEAGPIQFGESARTIAGSHARAGALVDVALAFGSDYAVSLVNDAGDGFALRRTEAGPRVGIEVREVLNGAPGRVLASELMGPRDLLAVPIQVAGRARVLLLQAERVNGPGAPQEIARLRRGLAEAGHRLPVPAAPLLRAKPQ